MLALSRIERLFPTEWRHFAPSPKRQYIARVQEELQSFGIVSPRERGFDGFCNVPRYFHPDADEEGLALSLELICWYFFFDDPFDDGTVSTSSGARLVERMLSVLARGQLPRRPTPTERLCARIRQRALILAGPRPAVAKRLIDRCSDWVRSILPITTRGRKVPDLAQYDRLRLVNVGILPEYVLNEIIGGWSLESSFLRLREITRLGDLAAMMIAYSNDVYSYEREARRGTQMNSLELRQRRGGMSLERAYEEQLAQIEEKVAEFVSLETVLEARGLLGWATPGDTARTACRRREQTHYVDDIKAIVVGNHYWSLADGRYDSRTSPFAELRARAARRRPLRAGH
jgi:hypothetical protein